MSFLLGALGAAEPLLRYGGGHILSKGSSWLSKGLDWVIPRLGGTLDAGVGKTVKDWALKKYDESFGGMMDYATSYNMKKKIPIVAKTSAEAASAMKDRLGGGQTTALAPATMDGIERG